jgi:hypothetical protein
MQIIVKEGSPMMMSSMLRLSLVAVCLAWVSMTAALGDEPPPLRWKFTVGEEIQYEFRQTSKVVTNLDGKETVNTTGLMLDLSWKVKSVQNGVGVISQTLRQARYEFKGDGQDAVYDSKDATIPTGGIARSLYSVYKPALETESTLKVNQRGEILEAHVSDKVVEALKQSPFVASADGGTVFSNLGLKNLLGQSLPILPDKPTRKGETWSNQLELPTPQFRMSLVRRYTLASSEASAARIDAALDVALKPAAELPFTVEVNKKTSKGNGTYTFDLATGRIARAQVHLGLDLVIKHGGEEARQTNVIDFEVTLKKERPPAASDVRSPGLD